MKDREKDDKSSNVPGSQSTQKDEQGKEKAQFKFSTPLLRVRKYARAITQGVGPVMQGVGPATVMKFHEDKARAKKQARAKEKARKQEKKKTQSIAKFYPNNFLPLTTLRQMTEDELIQFRTITYHREEYLEEQRAYEEAKANEQAKAEKVSPNKKAKVNKKAKAKEPVEQREWPIDQRKEFERQKEIESRTAENVQSYLTGLGIEIDLDWLRKYNNKELDKLARIVKDYTLGFGPIEVFREKHIKDIIRDRKLVDLNANIYPYFAITCRLQNEINYDFISSFTNRELVRFADIIQKLHTIVPKKAKALKGYPNYLINLFIESSGESFKDKKFKRILKGGLDKGFDEFRNKLEIFKERLENNITSYVNDIKKLLYKTIKTYVADLKESLKNENITEENREKIETAISALLEVYDKVTEHYKSWKERSVYDDNYDEALNELEQQFRDCNKKIEKIVAKIELKKETKDSCEIMVNSIDFSNPMKKNIKNIQPRTIRVEVNATIGPKLIAEYSTAELKTLSTIIKSSKYNNKFKTINTKPAAEENEKLAPHYSYISNLFNRENGKEMEQLEARTRSEMKNRNLSSSISELYRLPLHLSESIIKDFVSTKGPDYFTHSHDVIVDLAEFIVNCQAKKLNDVRDMKENIIQMLNEAQECILALSNLMKSTKSSKMFAYIEESINVLGLACYKCAYHHTQLARLTILSNNYYNYSELHKNEIDAAIEEANKVITTLQLGKNKQINTSKDNNNVTPSLSNIMKVIHDVQSSISLTASNQLYDAKSPTYISKEKVDSSYYEEHEDDKKEKAEYENDKEETDESEDDDQEETDESEDDQEETALNETMIVLEEFHRDIDEFQDIKSEESHQDKTVERKSNIPWDGVSSYTEDGSSDDSHSDEEEDDNFNEELEIGMHQNLQIRSGIINNIRKLGIKIDTTLLEKYNESDLNKIYDIFRKLTQENQPVIHELLESKTKSKVDGLVGPVPPYLLNEFLLEDTVQSNIKNKCFKAGDWLNNALAEFILDHRTELMKKQNDLEEQMKIQNEYEKNIVTTDLKKVNVTGRPIHNRRRRPSANQSATVENKEAASVENKEKSGHEEKPVSSTPDPKKKEKWMQELDMLDTLESDLKSVKIPTAEVEKVNETANVNPVSASAVSISSTATVTNTQRPSVNQPASVDKEKWMLQLDNIESELRSVKIPTPGIKKANETNNNRVENTFKAIRSDLTKANKATSITTVSITQTSSAVSFSQQSNITFFSKMNTSQSSEDETNAAFDENKLNVSEKDDESQSLDESYDYSEESQDYSEESNDYYENSHDDSEESENDINLDEFETLGQTLQEMARQRKAGVNDDDFVDLDDWSEEDQAEQAKAVVNRSPQGGNSKLFKEKKQSSAEDSQSYNQDQKEYKKKMINE